MHTTRRVFIWTVWTQVQGLRLGSVRMVKEMLLKLTQFFLRYPVSPAGPMLTDRVVIETSERVRASFWYRLLLYQVKIKCMFPDIHYKLVTTLREMLEIRRNSNYKLVNNMILDDEFFHWI